MKQRDVYLLIGYKHIYVTVFLLISFRNYFMALELQYIIADVTAVFANTVFSDKDKILKIFIHQTR